jgi:hypothetical protein
MVSHGIVEAQRTDGIVKPALIFENEKSAIILQNFDRRLISIIKPCHSCKLYLCESHDLQSESLDLQNFDQQFHTIGTSKKLASFLIKSFFLQSFKKFFTWTFFRSFTARMEISYTGSSRASSILSEPKFG